jgi:hypothetical protein
MANGNGNLWQDFFLDYEPEMAYYSAAPFGTGASAASPFGGGFSPASQSYWSGQYGTVMNQYLGETGRAQRDWKPGDPDPPFTKFTDFLEQYPWTERYTALTPRGRPGGSTARFAPSTRRMY